MPDESTGDRLRRSRLAIKPKMSQEALAKLIGTTRSAIAQCELGMSNSMTAENLAKAAKALGKSPGWLATGDGPENDPGALGEAVAALPEAGRVAVYDFMLYHLDKAAPVLGEKAGHYATMIEGIKADMEKKASPGEPAPKHPAKTTKTK